MKKKLIEIFNNHYVKVVRKTADQATKTLGNSMH